MKMLPRLVCRVRGHTMEKVRHDTARGPVCGLSHFQTCSRCGHTIVVADCEHAQCLTTIRRFRDAGGSVVGDTREWLSPR